MRLLATWIQGAADGERGPKAKPARVFDNGKVSDHHAIIPTGRIERLDPDSQKVFDAVASRLVQAFLNDKVQELTSVRAVSNQVPFRARGTVIVEPGWSALEQPANADQAADGDGEPKKKKGKKQKGDDDDENQTLPAFTQGENGPHAPYLHEGKTKPPPAFTENTLLGAMETAGKLIDDESLRQAMKGRGLGTPATRASILETLISRSYVRRDKKALRVTDLGRYLIAIIQDPQLKSAELTGDWEFRLGEVERGARTRDDFMSGIRDSVHDLIEKNLAPRALPEGLGACPRCQAAVIEGRAAYGCSRWNDGCALRIPKDFQGFAIRPQHVRELVTRGIVLAPRTKLTFDLGARYDVFECVAGLEERSGPLAHAIFRVYADGKLLWEATQDGASATPHELKLPITGCKELAIEADFGERFDLGDHCAFADARVLKSTGASK
jgi:DNA topoisomerase-3